MKAFVILSFAILQAISALCQKNILNEENILKNNNIKLLKVTNCLVKEGCYTSYYEYNRNGQMVRRPWFNGMEDAWEYYPDGKLKAESTTYPEYMSLDYTYFSSYYYKQNGELDFIILKHYQNDTALIDTLPPKEPQKKKEVLGIRNSLNQITEHEVGELGYPCGIHYEGKHIIRYTYAENGLISHGEIYDEQGKLIIDLKYEYETH